MPRQPKDMSRAEFAVWMWRELEIEQAVEELREVYADDSLSDLRKRAAEKLDALTGRLPSDVAGGFRLRCIPTPVFRAEADHKVIRSDNDPSDSTLSIDGVPVGRVFAVEFRRTSPTVEKVRGGALFRRLALLCRRLIGGRS